MKIRIISVLIFFSAVFNSAFAQNDADALRYSMLNYGSTARSLGMGNSFGALGADFSVLGTNPGGIAVYRKSEFSITPYFSNRNIESGYLDQSASDNFFKFAFGNFGMVWAYPSRKESSAVKSWSFGIGYNRMNDFSSNTVATGINKRNSILDSYLGQITNTSPENIPSEFPFDVNLAWQTFLIDTANGNYFSAVPSGNVKQRRITETRGGQGEWDFTGGANVNNMLYLGLTLGISSIRYEHDVIWEETDPDNAINDFKGLKFTENLKTSGTGWNLKFGAIYKPVEEVRIGAAIHTPTFYTLSDDYKTNIRASFDDGDVLNYASPDFIPFDYEIKTPFRVIASLGLVLAQQVAVNFDYEFLDYSQAKTDAVDNNFDDYFQDINSIINAKYSTSHNFRAGAEFRYDMLRFRLGGQYSTSPFIEELRGTYETDLSRYSGTAGFGFRAEKYYVDLGYAYSETGSFLRPYSVSNQEVSGITYKQKDHRLLITLGFLF